MKIILFSLILLFPFSAFSQSTSPILQPEDIKASVRMLLASEQVRDQAWAAYYVSKFRWAEFTPDLEKMLARQNVPSVEYLHRAALDALIQLNAVVKAETLRPHFDRFPNQVVILLTLDPTGNEQPFLSLLEKKQPDEIWLALCNLLVKLRSKGLATRLLREMKIKPSILVANSNMGIGGGGYSSGCGDGWLTIPAGFPPLVNYALTRIEKAGAVVLAVGPHTIYYERSERQIKSGELGIGGCFSEGNRDYYRVEYLAALLNLTKEQLKFSTSPAFTIVWKELLLYQREMRSIKLKVRQSYDQLLEKLIAADLLTTAEAKELRPHIEFTIDDQRNDKSIALPKP